MGMQIFRSGMKAKMRKSIHLILRKRLFQELDTIKKKNKKTYLVACKAYALRCRCPGLVSRFQCQ